MANNLKRRYSMQMAYFKYGHTPTNRKWITAAVTAACIVLVLMLCLLFIGDKMSMKTVLWIRGFTGVFALMSIICAAIFYYSIYTAYWNDPTNSN